MYSVKEVVYSEWETHLKEIQHFNILQHWLYGEAKEQTSKWKAVRFLITRDGQFVALAQLLVLTFPFLGGVARLNKVQLLSKREIRKVGQDGMLNFGEVQTIGPNASGELW